MVVVAMAPLIDSLENNTNNASSSDTTTTPPPPSSSSSAKSSPEENKENRNMTEVDMEPFEWSENLKNILKKSGKFRISRHGESQFNLTGKIGGNSGLSANGLKYSVALGDYINNLNLQDLKVWTSEYLRTNQTGQHIKGEKTQQAGLNEIQSGEHDSLTYEEIAEMYPREFALRDQDKLRYRYPKGESYLDVCRRLVPVLSQIKKEENLLIISHQAVIRCILNAIEGNPLDSLPYTKVPLHTVLEINFDTKDGKPEIRKIPLKVECVDTYRAKPENCQVDRKLSEAINGVPYHI